MDPDRRRFIGFLGLMFARILLPKSPARAAKRKKPVILVVSGWQDVNIGDIGHTPGFLHVLKEFLPDAHVILWKKGGGKEVHALLRGHFPEIPVIYGKVETDGTVDSKEVRDAFQEADLMIHGSGPSVVGQANLEAWVRATGKPFGIFGATIQHIDENLKTLLKKASFIFTRETASVEVLRKAGIEGNHVSFAPDATFYMNIRDEEKAGRFLKEHGLREKRFICAVPRLRITPYYKFTANNYTPERIREIEDLNNRCKEPDHAKLREAMVAWVRETGNRVLVCPEMAYQVDIMDELLIDPLPEDVKPFVVKRGYWFPDEAASVYAKAHTVLSFECHSPIIAAASGTPFFYLRQPEDTIKGQMYYDLGFGDWTFEIERTGGKQVADRLREVWTDYPGAQKKLKTGMDKIATIYGKCTELIGRLLVPQGA
jgi:polysaccharide pyruvyl transferase WcaK-like protein